MRPNLANSMSLGLGTRTGRHPLSFRRRIRRRDLCAGLDDAVFDIEVPGGKDTSLSPINGRQAGTIRAVVVVVVARGGVENGAEAHVERGMVVEGGQEAFRS